MGCEGLVSPQELGAGGSAHSSGPGWVSRPPAPPSPAPSPLHDAFAFVELGRAACAPSRFVLLSGEGGRGVHERLPPGRATSWAHSAWPGAGPGHLTMRSLTQHPQVTGVCFLLYFIVHLVAISIDPAESTVRHKNYHRQVPPSFDRSQHTHVIHNRFCCLCQVPV